ncbi:MAG: NAD(+)/NADH kinase [Candidatus Aureabacteria bacterium]|nr:NAD(+)/NADH kinase [Candidatus Auribacterota bacterium]
MKARKVGIFPNPRKKECLEYIRTLTGLFKKRGIDVYIPDFLPSLPDGGFRSVSLKSFLNKVDIVLVLGGDGTFLHAARECHGVKAPLLGINMGSFGFLTEFTKEDFLASMDAVIKGDYRIVDLLMLEVKVIRKNRRIADFTALNDAVLSRGSFSRALEIQVNLGDEFLNEYFADGLIIATPTGSTAHSLSAGGPIVAQSMKSVLITPICPHALTNRPIIVPSETKVSLLVKKAEKNARLTVDGQISLDLKKGDAIIAGRHRNSVKLVRPAQRSYYGILRDKLNWSGTYRNKW